MWTLSLLLFTLRFVNSSDDDNFPINELYLKTSNIYQKAHDLYLESQLIKGNISSIEVAEELLNQTLDETVYEEYIPMEISSGINEFNELGNKAMEFKKTKTSDEDRKRVEDGLSALEDLKKVDLKSIQVHKETIKDIEILKKHADFRVENLKDEELDKLSYSWNLQCIHVDMALRTAPKDQPLSDKGHREVDRIKTSIRDIFHESRRFTDIMDKLLKNIPMHIYDINPLQRMRDIVEAAESSVSMVKWLKHSSSSVILVENELRKLEEVRDGQLIEKVSGFIKKVENTLGSLKRVRISKDGMKKYENIDSVKPLLELISKFSSYLNSIEWMSSKIRKRWIPLVEHLNSIQIPSGNLTEQFSFPKECPEISFDISDEMKHLLIVFEPLEKFSKIASKLKESVGRIKENQFIALEDEFEKVSEDFDKIPLEEALNRTIWRVNIDELHKIKKDLELVRRSKGDDKKSQIEVWLLDSHNLLRKFELRDAIKMVDVITDKLVELENQLKCYSDLNVSPSDIKKSMDLPGEVWNFNPKLMNYVLEHVLYFKKIYKKIMKIKEWKIEDQGSLEIFPLDSDDVKGIMDGMEVLKSLKNVEVIWNKMRRWNGFEKSEVENTWNSVRNGIEKVKNKLSEVRSQSKLPDIQELISNIELSNDVTEVDSLIDFIQRKYKGIIRSQYLNILEDIKYLIINFGDFPNKIQKMNEGIEKYEKWIGDDCSLTNSDNCTTTPFLITETSEEPKNEEL